MPQQQGLATINASPELLKKMATWLPKSDYRCDWCGDNFIAVADPKEPHLWGCLNCKRATLYPDIMFHKFGRKKMAVFTQA